MELSHIPCQFVVNMLKLVKHQTTINQRLEFLMHIVRSKPIAEQVNEIIRERIRSEVYTPGQRLPSEGEFSAEFGVSRATVRTVLAKLSVEGLILRKQGDGTYVNEQIREINTHLGGLWDFAHLIERSGFESSIQPLSIEKVTATESHARALAVNVGDELLSMVRLFCANKQPAILAKNLFPVSLLINRDTEIDGTLRIRAILKKYFSKEIAFVTTEISTARTGEDANVLSISPDHYLLSLKMTFYSKDNRPLTIGDNYLNDNVLKLRLVQAWN